MIFGIYFVERIHSIILSKYKKYNNRLYKNNKKYFLFFIIYNSHDSHNSHGSDLVEHFGDAVVQFSDKVAVL